MKANPLRMGIISGAGPLAGALLFQKIIEICQQQYGCRQDQDFPLIWLLSYPFSDMLAKGKSQRGLIQSELKSCFDMLAENEVDAAAIACNTLHAFLEERPSLPFIHIIEETANYLKEIGVERSLVLCTTTSAELKLHKRYFGCFYPEKKEQEGIQELIYKIMAGKHAQQDVLDLSLSLNQSFARSGKPVGLVLGCTEFSVLNEQFPLHRHGLSHHFVVIDPTIVLANQMCRTMYKTKKAGNDQNERIFNQLRQARV